MKLKVPRGIFLKAAPMSKIFQNYFSNSQKGAAPYPNMYIWRSYILKRYGVCVSVRWHVEILWRSAKLARARCERSRVRSPPRSNLFAFLVWGPGYFFCQIELFFATGAVRPVTPIHGSRDRYPTSATFFCFINWAFLLSPKLFSLWDPFVTGPVGTFRNNYEIIAKLLRNRQGQSLYKQ